MFRIMISIKPSFIVINSTYYILEKIQSSVYKNSKSILKKEHFSLVHNLKKTLDEK